MHTAEKICGIGMRVRISKSGCFCHTTFVLVAQERIQRHQNEPYHGYHKGRPCDYWVEEGGRQLEHSPTREEGGVDYSTTLTLIHTASRRLSYLLASWIILMEIWMAFAKKIISRISTNRTTVAKMADGEGGRRDIVTEYSGYANKHPTILISAPQSRTR